MVGTEEEQGSEAAFDLRWCRDSLCRVSGLYRRRPDGDLQYDGERPGSGWHAHGYFPRWLWLLLDGAAERVRVWKRRWLLAGTTRTCHSRPPDDPPRMRSCTLVVALVLWSWLAGEAGLHGCTPVLPDLGERPCSRTAQRWLARARPNALQIQQAVRSAVIERSEPRPVERLFPRGLPPPPGLLRRRWQDPPLVASLWRALALALHGASALLLPVTLLLAEARGRWEGAIDSPLP
jgi:hypothetical protein